MKKILFALSLFWTSFAVAQPLAPPIDFESAMIPYTFTDFDGGAATVINNPGAAGINTSAKVGQMIKNPGQVWGGSFLTMTNPLDFTTNKIFKMKVWSPRVGARVILKVENPTNGAIFFEKEDTSTVANAWEELTFDFTAIDVNQTYQKISLIWDLGVAGDGSPNFTFYFDDIELIAGPAPLNQIDLPVTFEDTLVDYTLTDFGGNASAVVVDPTNPMNTVARAIKDSTSQLWAGTTISTPLGLANPIPFSAAGTSIAVRVWSPDSGIVVRLKAEDHTNGNISVETETPTLVAGAWDTLIFDFTNEVMNTAALNLANTYDMLSIFFNFGTDGATAGTKTYYFDDVMFVTPAALAQIDLPVTFEDTTVDYTLTDFGGNVHTIVTDPTNPMNTVGEVVKDTTAQTWAGTTISTPSGLANPIPFTQVGSFMTVRVWSPDAGIPIRLKVEDHTNNAISVETEATTTMAGAWETLVFDFNNEVNGTAAIDFMNTYDMVSIFFNFGTDGATAGNKTYYFDDVYFGFNPATLAQIDLPVTFEDSLTDYTMTDFGGNASMLVIDPTDPNNVVAEAVKDTAAQVWAGTTISTTNGLANEIPFTMMETRMSVRVWSPDAGITIRLKVEDHTNAAISCETETNTTMAGAWETIVFDFSSEVGGTAVLDLNNTYDLVSIFFNFGTDGATAGTKTYYFDDVMFGAPANPLAQIDLPITFEDTMVDYTMTSFGGNAHDLIVDPTDPMNTVGEVVKDTAALAWAGTTCSTPMGLANAIPFSATATKISVKVWSPDAGVVIRLKAEDRLNSMIAVETETSTTVAGAWETLIFDFGDEVMGTPALDLNNTYNLLSIFFNFGTDGATAGTKTYYFDDVMMDNSVSIDDAAIEGLRFYPNPVQDRLTLEATQPMETIAVFNVMGQEMMRTAPESMQTALDLNTLSAGTYLIQVSSGTARSNFRIVKN